MNSDERLWLYAETAGKLNALKLHLVYSSEAQLAAAAILHSLTRICYREEDRKRNIHAVSYVRLGGYVVWEGQLIWFGRWIAKWRIFVSRLLTFMNEAERCERLLWIR